VTHYRDRDVFTLVLTLPLWFMNFGTLGDAVVFVGLVYVWARALRGLWRTWSSARRLG